MKKFFMFIFILFLFQSCISEWDKALDEKTLDYKWINKSSWCNKNNTEIKILDEVQKLHIFIKIYDWEKLMKDSIHLDSISEIKYYLRFFVDGKVATLPQELIKSYSYKTYKGKSNSLIIPLEIKTRAANDEMEAYIPYLALKSVKKGKQHLYCELFAVKQSQFATDSPVVQKAIPQIKGRWDMQINMPEIYKTVIYSAGIFLENDKKFTPVGMDFSIFGSGLPDIYWTIFIPAHDSTDFSNFLWRSGEATNSYNYTDSDTVSVLHFSPKDGLIIGVYDRDDFSRDDFIGDWFGKISDITSDTFKSLAFDHITSFKIKAVQKGCVN
jgi:hypothetical protein